MPALGKSGTCRMCCLRSMRSLSSPSSIDCERLVGRAGFFGIDEHRIDSRSSRTHAKGSLDTGDRFHLALHERFDPPIGQVPHPPGYTFTECGVTREIAEPDTLHATANQKPPSHAHGKTGLYRPGPRHGAAAEAAALRNVERTLQRAPPFVRQPYRHNDAVCSKPRSRGRPPGVPGHGIDNTMITSASA